MKLLKIIIALIILSSLTSCAGKKIVPEFRINGVIMPNEAMNIVLANEEKKEIRIIWYYSRVYDKKIVTPKDSEIVKEKQPLNMEVPKILSSDTSEVGINVLVFNPHFLRYRIVMLEPNEKKVYEGIRDNFEVFLNGPIAKDRQFKIGARIDLMGENRSFVANSAIIEDLVYTINSSAD